MRSCVRPLLRLRRSSAGVVAAAGADGTGGRAAGRRPGSRSTPHRHGLERVAVILHGGEPLLLGAGTPAAHPRRAAVDDRPGSDARPQAAVQRDAAHARPLRDPGPARGERRRVAGRRSAGERSAPSVRERPELALQGAPGPRPTAQAGVPAARTAACSAPSTWTTTPCASTRRCCGSRHRASTSCCRTPPGTGRRPGVRLRRVAAADPRQMGGGRQAGLDQAVRVHRLPGAGRAAAERSRSASTTRPSR